METLTPRQFLSQYLGKNPEDIDIPDELEDLKGAAQSISNEERIRRAEELEDMDSSELSSEFGLK